MNDMNNFYREFRDFRDRIAAKTIELVETEVKQVIQEFWAEHNDWITRTFIRPYVMKLLYKLIKKI